DYGMMPAGSEPRAHRAWRSEGGPSGAEIVYRLNGPAQGPVRVLIVNTAGDTIARLPGTTNAGLNRVAWNLLPTGDEVVVAGGGGRKQAQVLRVVHVAPGDVSVLAPMRER